MLQAYLYARMYYNKVRKTVHHWWETYLLFKCSIVVLPVYSLLIIIGLYCIMYDIDVIPPLKTIYQFVILVLSAAVIFIFVLLLATFNGDNRPPSDDCDSANVDLEIDLDSISLPRRRNSFRSGRGGRGSSRPRSSITSSIFSTIFGPYYDEDGDDDLDDEDFLDPEDLMALAAAASDSHHPHEYRIAMNSADLRNSNLHSIIPTFDDLPPLMMNQAQNRLITSLEEATDGLEYYLDQCNSFELSPEDHMVTPRPGCSINKALEEMRHEHQNRNRYPEGDYNSATILPSQSSYPVNPPPGYYDPATSYRYSNRGGLPGPNFYHHHQTASASSSSSNHFSNVAHHSPPPPHPPIYSSTNNLHLHHNNNQSNNQQQQPTPAAAASTSTNFAELPPSYEEATKAS